MPLSNYVKALPRSRYFFVMKRDVATHNINACYTGITGSSFDTLATQTHPAVRTQEFPASALALTAYKHPFVT